MTSTPSFFSDASRLLQKFLVAVLLQTLAFAATYVEAPSTFSKTDLVGIAVLGLAVNVACMLVLLFLLRFEFIVNVVLSLVVLTGVATMHVVHTELYFPENRIALVAACLAAAFVLFVAFRVVDDWRPGGTDWRPGGTVLSAATLLLIAILVGGYFLRNINKDPIDVDEDPIDVDITNIRDILFEETPNLYFISYDAMIPRPLLRGFLNIENTELHDLFDEQFRRFPNFFSNAYATSPSFAALLSLDRETRVAYSRHRVEGGALLTGEYPSPLYRILRKNGYEITFMYRDRYFGNFKGAYIDNYITPKSGIVCDKLDPNLRSLSFWGYCQLKLIERAIGIRDTGRPSIIEHIILSAGANANDAPQFVFTYFNLPGHIGRWFRHGDEPALQGYRNQYLRRSNQAARLLTSIIEGIQHRDPDAALFVFGDHGTFVSGGIEIEDDPAFYLLDRHGVLGGVYPADWCVEHFDEASSKGYITIVDAVHAILRCLSGGQEVRNTPRKHSDVFQLQPKYRYKDFLYE